MAKQKQDIKPTEIDLTVKTELEKFRKYYSTYPANIFTIRKMIVEIFDILNPISEIGKTNSGYFVNKFLASVNLSGGHPYCLGLLQWIIAFICDTLNLKDILPKNTGSTRQLYNWAKQNNLLVYHPQDVEIGDMPILAYNSTQGHIFVITKIHIPVTTRRNIFMYETWSGNTTEINDNNLREGGNIAKSNWYADKFPIGEKRKLYPCLLGYLSLQKCFNTFMELNA